MKGLVLQMLEGKLLRERDRLAWLRKQRRDIEREIRVATAEIWYIRRRIEQEEQLGDGGKST